MEWMLMPLRRYADFQGRSRRMEFWMFQLFTWLLWMVLIILFLVIGGAALFASGGLENGEPTESSLAALGGGALLILGIAVIMWLALLIPSLAVTVRRLHDSNRTGYWILAPMIPNVVAVVAQAQDMRALGLIASLFQFGLAITLLVFYFLPGTTGENRFGPDPKGGTDFDVFA